MTISYSGSFVRLLRRWKGSVWKAVWKEAAGFLVLYYILRIILRYALSKDHFETAKNVVAIFDSWTTKVPLQFLLGFYVGQVVTRWWAQVQMVPWPDEIMVWTNAFLFKNDPVTREKRKTIARYLILTETLVFRNVSTRIRKRFPTIQSLVDAELMTKQEFDLYHKTGVENTRWFLPLQWIISGIVVPATKANEIPGAGAGTLVAKINDFRNALKNLYLYDWVCIPLVYTQTCSVVVYGYFGFCLIGHQYMSPEKDLYIPYLTLLQFIFFVGWFKVAQDLMRPFGEDDDDVELNVILDRHSSVARSFAEQLCVLIPTGNFHDERTPFSSSSAATSPMSELSTPIGEGSVYEDDPPNYPLAYSKAALRSANHVPKMHAGVKIKDPKGTEMVIVKNHVLQRKLKDPANTEAQIDQHDSAESEAKGAVRHESKNAGPKNYF